MKDKLRVQSDLNLQTGRNALQAGTLDATAPEVIETSTAATWGYAYTMEDFLQWDMRIDYLYNARLSGWISGRNLLNRANPLYAGYNAQGIRFQLGFSYAF